MSWPLLLLPTADLFRLCGVRPQWPVPRGGKQVTGAAEKQVAEMQSWAEESTEVSGETGEVADDTSEATGKDEVSGVFSGKVGDELGKDVGETGVGKEAGEGSGEMGEGNQIAGETEEGGEPGEEEAGEAAP